MAAYSRGDLEEARRLLALYEEANGEVKDANALPTFQPPPKIEREPQKATGPQPIPSFEDWTMFQATIWDNWFADVKEGQRKSPVQYGFAIEVWTKQAVNLRKPDYVGSTRLYLHDMWLPNITMLSGDERTISKRRDDGSRERVVVKGVPKISPEYFEFLASQHAKGDKSLRYGMISTRTSGYTDFQSIRIELLQGESPTWTKLAVRGQELSIEPEWWSSFTPKQKLLTASAVERGDTTAPVAQARVDFAGVMPASNWETR